MIPHSLPFKTDQSIRQAYERLNASAVYAAVHGDVTGSEMFSNMAKALGWVLGEPNCTPEVQALIDNSPR